MSETPTGPKRRRPGFPWYGPTQIWLLVSLLVGVLSTRFTLYRWLPTIGGAVALLLVLWLMVTQTSECTLDEGVLCQPAFGLIITGAGALNTVFLGGRELLTTRAIK